MKLSVSQNQYLMFYIPVKFYFYLSYNTYILLFTLVVAKVSKSQNK